MEHQRIKSEHIVERFVTGELSPEEKEAFESHLRECSSCDQAVHECIEDATLVDKFIMGRLSPSEASFFEEHYFGCDRCFEAVRAAEKVSLGIKNAVQRGTLALTPPPTSFRKRLQYGLATLFLEPKPATILVLLLLLMLYPTWRGVVKLPELENEMNILRQPQANIKSFYVTEAQKRNGVAKGPQEAGIEEISLSPGDKSFLLHFTILDSDLKKQRYRVRILDPSGGIIWRIDELQSPGETGIFSILCYSGYFKSGEYHLEAEEFTLQDKATGKVYSFPFRLAIKN